MASSRLILGTDNRTSRDLIARSGGGSDARAALSLALLRWLRDLRTLQDWFVPAASPSPSPGHVMYMPVTDPAISMDEALNILSKQDEVLKSFPEVEWAVGKAGRAESSTDPAPVNMNETIVHLKPPEQWRAGITRESLIAEMDEKLRFPGVTNIWTQPIKNRIDMLATGIRSQVGIKIFGNDLKALEALSRRVADVVRNVRPLL